MNIRIFSMFTLVNKKLKIFVNTIPFWAFNSIWGVAEQNGPKNSSPLPFKSIIKIWWKSKFELNALLIGSHMGVEGVIYRCQLSQKIEQDLTFHSRQFGSLRWRITILWRFFENSPIFDRPKNKTSTPRKIKIRVLPQFDGDVKKAHYYF